MIERMLGSLMRLLGWWTYACRDVVDSGCEIQELIIVCAVSHEAEGETASTDNFVDLEFQKFTMTGKLDRSLFYIS